MHRSGTSSVAGTLVKLGIRPPKTPIGADKDNERGHWESSVITALHDEMLTSAGSRWHDWRPFNRDWYETPIAASFKARAKELLHDEFGDAPAFVLKDPRTCRFAEFWLDIFADEGIDTKVLIPVRSPLEVAQSHRTRDGFSLRKGLLLWLRHVLDAEKASREIPRVVFQWSALLDDWRTCVEQLAETLGIRWPALTDMTAAEIEQFLSRDLKHQRVSEDALDAHPELHAWVLETYAALRDLTREPRSKSAMAKLDKVRERLNEATRLFGGVLAEADLSYAQLMDTHQAAQNSTLSLRQELDTERSRVAELLSSIQAEQDRAFSIRSELDLERSRVVELSRNVQAEQDRALSIRRELDVERSRIVELETEAKAANDIRKEILENATSLETEIRALSNELCQINESKRKIEEENLSLTNCINIEKNKNETLIQRENELKEDNENLRAAISKLNDLLGVAQRDIIKLEQSAISNKPFWKSIRSWLNRETPQK